MVFPAGPPTPVWEVITGYTRYWLVVAALDLGVFEELAGGPRGLDELAEATGVASRRLAVVLDFLVTAGLLTTAGDRVFGLTPTTRGYLLRDSPLSMVEMVRYSPGPRTAWPELSATLRRGRPTRSVEDDAGLFYGRLAIASAPTQQAVAQATAALLPDPGEGALVLDLGAGAAPWAIGMLRAWPRAKALAVDLPTITPFAEAAAAEHGVADRFDVRAGSYLDAVLPIGEAAVVTIGHAIGLQSADLAKALLLRARGALRPGGFVVISDYFRPAEPPAGRGLEGSLPQSMALTLLANTYEAEVVELPTLLSWLAEVGLVAWTTRQFLPGQLVVVATEPGQAPPP
ncbi:methyltransferase [Frankia sp. CNm7]|uniref:Methyltransferase n=1 Tax=Frankia nepalensis TaxID=1836974 RepID=A0A937RND3_9ACTN|nr:methyltransferase [Frankia nepalensis]MBL7510578.1 methyltransferase [Frankia nepalensis]MBL7523911.1 methyltransferase [Frankia nepalensis]MBL7633365.1 methyltransferase [Frankia nepalensis]